MLDIKEIEKIKKLIDLGYTDYKIGKELKHSPNTVKKIRREYKKTKISQKKDEKLIFNSPIDQVQETIKNLKNIVKTEELKLEERKVLEKVIERLEKIIRVEVDERIDPSQLADVATSRLLILFRAGRPSDPRHPKNIARCARRSLLAHGYPGPDTLVSCSARRQYGAFVHRQ